MIAELIASFRDELGHRRDVDAPVLAHLLGGSTAPPSVGATVDVVLWHAVCDPGLALPTELSMASDGPLIDEDGELGIELWTQQELASLHAVWWIARRRGLVELRHRLARALRWHIGNIQPDNATHHPWAVHAFYELWHHEGNRDVLLHAQQLVHTTLVVRGRPDRFSACLLVDAARALELMARDAS